MQRNRTLSIIRKTIPTDRWLGFCLLVFTNVVLAFGQYEMPDKIADGDDIRAVSSIPNAPVSAEGSRPPQQTQLLLSANQYQAFKYCVIGGCVTLIFVLLGSMIRLSNGGHPDPQVSLGHYPATSPHFYPPYSWGYPHPPTGNSSNTAASQTKATESQTAKNPADPDVNSQMVGMSFPWPVSYLPTMQIGIPVAVPHSGVSGHQVNFNTSGLFATTHQHPTMSAPPSSKQDVVEPSGCDGVDDSSVVLKEEMQERSAEVEDHLPSRFTSVEEAVMRHLVTPGQVRESDETPTEGAIQDDEIRDLIAEDLANLTVETYGEIFVSEKPDSFADPSDVTHETGGEKCPNVDAGSRKVDAVSPMGNVESDEAADLKSQGLSIYHVEDAQDERRQVGATEDERAVASIFDSIVANTLKLKSLAS